MLRKVDNFAPAGLPVGRAALWSAGFGLSMGLSRFLANILPTEKLSAQLNTYEGTISSVLVAFLVRTKFIEKFIGPAASSIIAVTSMVNAVDQISSAYLGGSLRMKVNELVGQVTSMIPGMSGLGQASTVVAPREQLYGLGQSPVAMPVPRLTQLERKLAAIAA